MALGKRFTYAFDDSGGVEPLLDKNRMFFPGDHPFFLIVALGINDDLLEGFNREWQLLRTDIQSALGSATLPPLHARLMFGDRKPPTYRGSINPYLHASREEVLAWYMRGLGLVTRCFRRRGGGDLLAVVYDREASGKPWEAVFQQEEAEAEGEFLKLIDRKRSPKLHQKYIAHVSAALAMPTLDMFIGIQETMRQCGGSASILLDGYSDADGFNEDAAFGFLNAHLLLSHISSVHAVPDTDSEALCQAADLVAYSTFRTELAAVRGVPLESWAREAATLLKPPGLCAMDIPRWLLRHRARARNRAIYNAARYAIAYHEIQKYAPEIVTRYFQTPEEFLAQCQAVSEANMATERYLPILRAGVLETWQATRHQNGEDRSKSGPVTEG